MFDSLRKKFGSWFSKEEEKSKNAKKSKKSKKSSETSKSSKNSKKSSKKEKISKSSKSIKNTKTKQSQKKEEKKIIKLNLEPEKLEIFKPELKLNQKTEEESEEEEEKKPSFFSRMINKFSTSTLTKENFDEIFSEIEMTLLENNVALEVVDKIKENLEKDLVGIEVKKNEIESTILKSLKDSILSVLIEPADLIGTINSSLSSPFVILFFGINGSGKTTSLAKLASFLKKNKISCVMAAADTFRAASIEQLQKHGLSLGIEVISSQYGADPAAVAFDAIKHAKKHSIRCVLIDTAGRMYTKSNLLKEMEKIIRVSNPNLKIFVGESITGNDATEQARTFNESVGIDGIILSKADIDEKAGTILSVSQVTGKPIYFLGTGQDMGDLVVFNKRDILKHLGLE